MDDDLQNLLNQLDIDGSDIDATPNANEQVADNVTEVEVPAKAPEPVGTSSLEIKTDAVTGVSEAQEVIILYKSQIEDALTSNRDPQRMYVDGLVQAVEVKSNINLTMVKIMEANAKMLASLKAGSSLNIKNNINVAASNDKELENILDEPITEIDDY